MPSKAIETKIISPSSLVAWAQNPVASLMRKYNIMGRGGSLAPRNLGDHIPGTVESIEGSHIHKALEAGFEKFNKTLRDGKFPGAEGINRVLQETASYTENALAALGVDSRPHSDAIKGAIFTYGREYYDRVSSHIGKRVDGKVLDARDVLSRVQLLPERTFSAFVGQGSPQSKIVRGKMDLVIADFIDRYAGIIDYKSLHSADMLTKLNEVGWQPKSYMYMLAKTYPGAFDKIAFEYGAMVPSSEPNGIRSFKRINPLKSEADIGAIEKEMIVLMSEIQNKEVMAYEKIRRGGREAFEKWIAEDLMPNMTDKVTGAMKLLPTLDDLKYNWSVPDIFLDEIMQAHGEFGIDGEKFIATMSKKWEKVSSATANEAASKAFGQETEKAVADYISDANTAIKELQEYSYSSGRMGAGIDSLRKQVEESADLLARSYNSAKTYQRGMFQDEVVHGAISARAKVPISILNPRMPATWLSKRMRDSLAYTAKERVREISKALDFPSYLLEDKVLDNVFRDKTFAQKLYYTAQGNMLTAMGKERLPFNRTYLEKIIRRPDLWVGRNMATMIDDQITSETVYHIYNEDKKLIEKHLGKISTERFDVAKDMEAIKEGLVKHKVLKASPETFLSQLARSEAYGALIKTQTVHGTKFPMSTMAKAGILAYMAGTLGIMTALTTKVQKATNYVLGQDEEVDTGDHASAYTNVRRLVHSDFGSGVRDFVPIGSIWSALAAGGRKGITAIKDLLSRGVGLGIPTDAAEAASAGEGLKKVMGSLRGGPLAPALLFGASAIAMFMTTGILTNIKPNDQRRIEIDERKKRFKRLKRQYWNSDSSMPEPESDLRKSHREFSPIGSPVIWASRLVNAFSAFRYASAEGLATELADGLKFAYRDLKGSITGLLNETSKETSAVVATRMAGVTGEKLTFAQTVKDGAVTPVKNALNRILPATMGTPGKSADKAAALTMGAEKSRATRILEGTLAGAMSDPLTAMSVLDSASRGKASMPIIETPLPDKMKRVDVVTSRPSGGDRTRYASDRTDMSRIHEASEVGALYSFVPIHKHREIVGFSGPGKETTSWANISMKLGSESGWPVGIFNNYEPGPVTYSPRRGISSPSVVASTKGVEKHISVNLSPNRGLVNITDYPGLVEGKTSPVQYAGINRMLTSWNRIRGGHYLNNDLANSATLMPV